MNTIWISQTVIEDIFLLGRQWLPKETGGVLMGYQTLTRETVITKMVGPGENAIHSQTSFKPDHDFHCREIAKIYEESNAAITYLGDWHTHPNSYAYLSGQDKTTLKSISKFDRARLKNPIMLIAAPPNKSFKIWTYLKTSKISCGTYEEKAFFVF